MTGWALGGVPRNVHNQHSTAMLLDKSLLQVSAAVLKGLLT